MERRFDSKSDLVLMGAGGHAKVVIETIQEYHEEYTIIGIIDRDESKVGQTVLGVKVIGLDAILSELYDAGLRKTFITLGTVGNYVPRLRLYEFVKSQGFKCINVIHGSSILSRYATMGEGNIILGGVIINADVCIGNNCIINTGSIIEHECKICNNVHVATGAKLCGQVTIGDNCLVGAGATIIQGISIGENCIIGAGSVVVRDIPANSKVVGNPAILTKER